MNIEEIERGLITRYRSKLYRPFTKAIQEYDLISEGDCIGVCLSGGKDSFVLAKLLQELQRHGQKNFDLKFLVMDPGYTDINLINLKENSRKLGIPIMIKQSNIFEVSQRMSKNPCYLCAKMRRGFLYSFAAEQGCNKIALGHHFDDVIETTLLNIFYAGCFKTMVPKIKAENFENMELIRPMMYVREQHIINYMKFCEIDAMSCGCAVEQSGDSSKRKEIKKLIANLKEDFKDIEKCIYRSAENVNLNRILGYKYNDEKITYIDMYERPDFK